MRIGVLTGGGDCPGLNAVIRAVVRKGVEVHGHEFVGFRDGWRGPLEGHTMELGVAQTRGILPRGGTILGSSRTNVMKVENGVERVRENLEKAGVDALVAIGGEDTLGVAEQLTHDGVPVVGVPKTIDNDLDATDYTFGFDTAVHIATEAIDRLRTTAESHHRALVVEVMGRHAGWIALHSGLAGGANVICFTTGRGSVYGCKPSPSLKLATNSAMYRRMSEDMDINCGAILDGELTVQQAGEQIFQRIIAVASGQRTMSEEHGMGEDEFAPWILGPTM